MQLAAQLFTLREFTKSPAGFREALERVKAIGYAGVQLSAVACMDGPAPAVDVQTAAAWLNELGLACCATHRKWSLLANDLEAEIQFHRRLNCSYVAVPSINQEFGTDPTAYHQFLEKAHPVAARLAQHNIKLGYHNHSHEFARNPETEKPSIEILSSPENAWLQMEVDTYWVADAGVCTSEFLAQCANRIDCIHVKDRDVVPGEGPVMAPVGLGNLNWDSILNVCRSAGTQWLIVEQDTCRTDPFDCLQSSFTFLQTRL